MEDILAILALLLACLGLVWAILHIHRTNAAIATTWPDWEGIQKPVGHAILLGLAVVLGLGSGWLTLSHSRPGPRPGPANGSPNDERVALEREIEALKGLLSAATRPAAVDAPPGPEPAVPSGPVSNDATLEMAESAAPPVEDSPPGERELPLLGLSAGTPEEKKADPEIEALSQAVIKSIISGSVKDLEPLTDQSLIDQFTINPFNFTQLQYGLKHRLVEGYTPTYLDSLRSATGTTYLWKIQTVKSGPDILERLAVRNGKIMGFRFDGIQ